LANGSHRRAVIGCTDDAHCRDESKIVQSHDGVIVTTSSHFIANLENRTSLAPCRSSRAVAVRRSITAAELPQSSFSAHSRLMWGGA
jgi:hypothetical protein